MNSGWTDIDLRSTYIYSPPLKNLFSPFALMARSLTEFLFIAGESRYHLLKCLVPVLRYQDTFILRIHLN